MPNSGATTSTTAADELPLPVAVLSAGPAALAQVAQSADTREDAALARLRAPGGRQSAASPAHLSHLGESGEPCMKNRVRNVAKSMMWRRAPTEASTRVVARVPRHINRDV